MQRLVRKSTPYHLFVAVVVSVSDNGHVTWYPLPQQSFVCDKRLGPVTFFFFGVRKGI